ncbi:MAG: flagellar transcriptional regulator FlhD [Comamonadaceae bacterium]|nr:MAG: flagellar transcriptional regulator FlhD [Comamonadaceae bacterium]
MNSDQILAEIKEANLTYLMLAQSLIREDKPQALFRLGISEESADLLEVLSPAQIMKLAGGNMLLCRFRADDDLVWNLLTSHNVPGRTANEATARLHANIVMAGRFAETSS